MTVPQNADFFTGCSKTIAKQGVCQRYFLTAEGMIGQIVTDQI